MICMYNYFFPKIYACINISLSIITFDLVVFTLKKESWAMDWWDVVPSTFLEPIFGNCWVGESFLLLIIFGKVLKLNFFGPLLFRHSWRRSKVYMNSPKNLRNTAALQVCSWYSCWFRLQYIHVDSCDCELKPEHFLVFVYPLARCPWIICVAWITKEISTTRLKLKQIWT